MKRSIKVKMIKTPSQFEDHRHFLAIDKNYGEFKRTYLSGNPMYEDFNSPNLWDRLNDRGLVSSSIDPMAWDRINIVKNTIHVNDSTRVLDIGFGSGDLEELILSGTPKTKWFGIDISPKSVQKVSKRFPEGIFEKGNMNSIKHKNKFFDYVIALEVLEHVKPTDVFKSLSEVYRVLKNDGELIISIPLNEGLEDLVSKGFNPNAHMREYTPDIIKTELMLSGFKIKDTKCLYAFSTNYKIKSFLCSVIPRLRSPNNLIVTAHKK